jgi:hypothetical protein
VVAAEAADEARVGGEAAPALADEGRAGKGGGLRREAEEDLAEKIFVFQRRLHRRRAGEAAVAAAEEEAAHLALATTGARFLLTIALAVGLIQSVVKCRP